MKPSLSCVCLLSLSVAACSAGGLVVQATRAVRAARQAVRVRRTNAGTGNSATGGTATSGGTGVAARARMVARRMAGARAARTAARLVQASARAGKRRAVRLGRPRLASNVRRHPGRSILASSYRKGRAHPRHGTPVDSFNMNAGFTATWRVRFGSGTRSISRRCWVARYRRPEF